ncbi:putative reverse transcriptase domain-containing protein [Tanacetum coccineum]
MSDPSLYDMLSKMRTWFYYKEGNEVFFRIKRRTQFKKLMNAYCDRQSVDMSSIAFLFDGRLLRADQTPDELEMEDGDEIDAMLHQVGGGFIIWASNEIVYLRHPLGPVLFCSCIAPANTYDKIRDNCKLLLHVWYLDDGTAIGDSEEVARVLDIIRLREGLFPVEIQRSPLGVDLLAGAVSNDADFISGLAMRRAVNAVDLMILLSQLHDSQIHFDMTMRQKVAFGCLRAPHAQDFILAIPIDGLVCRRACLDFFREHVAHYKELSGFKYQHDMVRDVFFDVCRRAEISVKKEAAVNFLTDLLDGRSTLRPTNNLVLDGSEGNICVSN